MGCVSSQEATKNNNELKPGSPAEDNQKCQDNVVHQEVETKAEVVVVESTDSEKTETQDAQKEETSDEKKSEEPTDAADGEEKKEEVEKVDEKVEEKVETEETSETPKEDVQEAEVDVAVVASTDVAETDVEKPVEEAVESENVDKTEEKPEEPVEEVEKTEEETKVEETTTEEVEQTEKVEEVAEEVTEEVAQVESNGVTVAAITAAEVVNSSEGVIPGVISEADLEILFTKAHTAHGFLDKPVEVELLKKALETAQFGPTAFNCLPMRVVFVKSPEGKEKLLTALMPGNVQQTSEAPVTAIVCYDTHFYEQLDKLCPGYGLSEKYKVDKPSNITTRNRNALLSAGYFLLALRSVGLNCGPMSGFDNEKVDELFLSDSHWKSDFLINIGYSDPDKNYPRNPKLAFEQIGQFQ